MPVAFDLGDRQPMDSQLNERLLNFGQFVRPNHCDNFDHELLSRLEAPTERSSENVWALMASD
jgi:hypothetical protein